MKRIALLAMVLLCAHGCVHAQETNTTPKVQDQDSSSQQKDTSADKSGPLKESSLDKPTKQANIEILSDTEGVDFDPYLKIVVEKVKAKWYSVIPDIARPPR